MAPKMHFLRDSCVSSVLKSSCIPTYTPVLRALLPCSHVKITIFCLFLFFTFFINLSYVYAADDNWLIGKWELTYDPDNSKTDWLEFRANGDVYNTWQNGERIEGLYKLNPNSVKAVFTYKGSDLITIFHFNKSKTELRIVTSKTGKESVYSKIK